MKKIIRRISAVALAVVLCFGMCTFARTVSALADEDDGTVDVTFEVQYCQTDARAMLSLVNSFRTGDEANYVDLDGNTVEVSGLGDMTYDYTLEEVAMQRAAEIALYFAHTRPDGESSCFTAYPSEYNSKGENIAYGYSTYTAAFNGWKEDNEDYDNQGHRRNMLGGYDLTKDSNGNVTTTEYNFTAIGIACVKYNGVCYWVQEFSKTAQNTTATTACDETKSVTVTVPTSSVTVTADTSPITMAKGDSADLPSVTGTCKIQRTMTIDVGEVDWESSDESVVTVSDGKITAVGAGTATVSATVSGTEFTVMVTVHDLIRHEALAATCTTAGNVEYWYCSDCGKYFTDISDWTETTLQDVTLSATGHTEVTDEGYAATCTEDGLTDGSHCSVCGEIITEQTAIPATGHTASHTDYLAPTYEADGNLEYWYCENCGKYFTDAEMMQETTWEDIVLEKLVAEDASKNEDASKDEEASKNEETSEPDEIEEQQKLEVHGLTDFGIKVTLTGLSPVAVSWTQKAVLVGTGTGTDDADDADVSEDAGDTTEVEDAGDVTEIDDADDTTEMDDTGDATGTDDAGEADETDATDDATKTAATESVATGDANLAYVWIAVICAAAATAFAARRRMAR